MVHVSDEKTHMTERAVAQLRAYARYIDEHAENIVGDIDKPNYIIEGGINVSFCITYDAAPTLVVTKEHLVLDMLTIYPNANFDTKEEAVERWNRRVSDGNH